MWRKTALLVCGRTPSFPLTVLVTVLAPVTEWLTLCGTKWTGMVHGILYIVSCKTLFIGVTTSFPPLGIPFLMHIMLLFAFLNIYCHLFIDMDTLIDICCFQVKSSCPIRECLSVCGFVVFSFTSFLLFCSSASPQFSIDQVVILLCWQFLSASCHQEASL